MDLRKMSTQDLITRKWELVGKQERISARIRVLEDAIDVKMAAGNRDDGAETLEIIDLEEEFFILSEKVCAIIDELNA